MSKKVEIVGKNILIGEWGKTNEFGGDWKVKVFGKWLDGALVLTLVFWSVPMIGLSVIVAWSLIS